MARSRIRRAGLAVLVAGVIVASGMAVAFATHTFPDVATGAFYHNAVEWIFNRAITAGCGGGLYCPNNFVTRGEMAVFMQNLGIALTPNTLVGMNFGGAVDPDASPVLCQTGSFTDSGYPRQAISNASLSLLSAGAMEIAMAMVYSTDGGTTWNFTSGLGAGGTGNFHRGFASASGQWFHVDHNDGPLTLVVGTTYKFGVQVLRESGTADATDSRCDMRVMVFNRNGAATPLQPQRTAPSDTNR